MSSGIESEPGPAEIGETLWPAERQPGHMDPWNVTWSEDGAWVNTPMNAAEGSHDCIQEPSLYQQECH